MKDLDLKKESFDISEIVLNGCFGKRFCFQGGLIFEITSTNKKGSIEVFIHSQFGVRLNRYLQFQLEKFIEENKIEDSCSIEYIDCY